MTEASLATRRVTAPPQQRPTQRRMAQIVDAAASVFARKGYHGASIQDIADGLGMRQASLYYYFRSKEDALAMVCRIGVEGFVERARAIADSAADPAGKLSALIRAHLLPMQDRGDYVRVFVTQRQHLPAGRRRPVQVAARDYEAIIASVIAAGVADGVFRDDLQSAEMSLTVLGACNAATGWIAGPQRMSVERAIRVVDTMMLRAVLR